MNSGQNFFRIVWLVGLAFTVISGLSLGKMWKTIPLIGPDNPSQVCQSLIPFSFDVSSDLSTTRFEQMKTFLMNQFLTSIFPENVEPAPFSTFDTKNYAYRRPNNVSKVVEVVQNTGQSDSGTSDVIQALEYFVDQNVAGLGSSTGMAVNTIIFVGSPLLDVDAATSLTPTLTSNGNTLTVVLMNATIDQTNYKQVFGLNLIVWSDPATTIAAIKNVTNCEPTAPIATTPVAATGSTTAYFINPCFGYIPFSFDVSQQVSATKFAELKDFLINQFLKKIFPPRIPPTYFSIFTNNVDSFRLQPDVDTIIGIVNRTTQESVSNSNIKLPLGNFVSKNVVGLGADDLMPVNTVVFTGSALSNSDLTVFSNYATNLTSNGNTLTIVLLESTIDQTNYRRFPNIKLVVWSDPFSTLSKIRENMQCRLIGF